ncbi:hypothetical protein EAG_07894 [Camponotus floridanus]|uniref:Uncharacterized protein n=1 Tax=Camponotus floridanus TaxID=104421 RepID=E2A3K3_CAMFO|nr:hypothetical protein EAG_07894 [Camponotus floridanus]
MRFTKDDACTVKLQSSQLTCQIRLSHADTRNNETPQAVSTQLAEWWGAGRLKSAESRARFLPPGRPDRGRRLPKRVRLGYVPRSAVRELSCQLHNGVVGLCSPVSLLPPSFLSGGPAQNVGPQIGMSLPDNISRNANNHDSTPGLFTCRYGSDLAIITTST